MSNALAKNGADRERGGSRKRGRDCERGGGRERRQAVSGGAGTRAASAAVVMEAAGGPEVLRLVERDAPEPGPGQVLVEVAAAGVNFIDTYHRSGLYPVALPFVPGLEGAGTVVAAGPQPSEQGGPNGPSESGGQGKSNEPNGSGRPSGSAPGGPAVGDRVAWVDACGSYARHAAVAADRAVAVPAGIGLETAAAAMLQGLTAHYLAASCPPLEEGMRVLVHAAAGGTGRLLVQMAKLRGAEVVATVGSAAKAELARSAGADHVIDYNADDLVAGVVAAVGPDAIDVVYDGVGAATYDAGLELLRRRGTMVTFGNASGPVEPKPPLHLSAKSLWLTRPTLWDYMADGAEYAARTAELFGWIASGRLDINISERLGLAEAGRAHELIAGRSNAGKILLIR